MAKGSRGGSHAFAVRTGNAAVSVVRIYMMHVTNQVGNSRLEAAIREIGNVLVGRKKCYHKLLTKIARKSAAPIVAENSDFDTTKI